MLLFLVVVVVVVVELQFSVPTVSACVWVNTYRRQTENSSKCRYFHHVLFCRHKNSTETKIAYNFISVAILLLKDRRLRGISVTPTSEFRALISLFSVRY